MSICLVVEAAAIVLLAVKVVLMKRSAREIRSQVDEKLREDTNTLIGISSGDRDMRELAEALNEQLKALRAERIRCRQGDIELKTAVTNISHDLRTPLTALISYLELLKGSPEKLPEYLPVLEERAEALSGLTEELFRYSVITSPEYEYAPEPVVINEALEESVLGAYAALSARNIEPVIDITEKKIVCLADRAALLRVFANILGNAVKYSDGDLYVSLDDDGVIRFENTAKSLSEVQVERLFDRFYTLESARSSTGLGLSIARFLVKRMGGEIFAGYENGRLIIGIKLAE